MRTSARVQTDLDNFLGPKMTPTTWIINNCSREKTKMLRHNLSRGQADFNQFIRQRNQIVVAADNFLREQILSPVLQFTLSKDCPVQDLDTSSYQVSDLEEIEFNWENSQLDMDAVFRPDTDTPFSPTTFDDFLMGDGSVENPIVLDEEEDKENTPPPTTPESVRPTEPPRLQRSRTFGARMENVPDYVFRNLFH